MRWRASLVLLLMAVVAVLAFGKSKKSAAEVRMYHSVVPLGILKFTTDSDPRAMYLLVTAESPAFANWETTETHRMPRGVDGTPIKFFPSHIDFRVTASARANELIGIDQYQIQMPPGALNDYMTKLHFRVSIFHGIDKRTVEPDSIREIGMPDDISYDERVYRVGFDIGRDVAVDDRIVLEVLSPGGDRLGKFHLEF